uniref:RING-CH-type domain-containing protein n=1 Tax=Plectus sambesii TaxID=2011161 RepID=A0A914UVD0_9BILA
MGEADGVSMNPDTADRRNNNVLVVDGGKRTVSQSSVGSENVSVFSDSPDNLRVSPRQRQDAVSSPTTMELSTLGAQATAGGTGRSILTSEGAAVCRICHGGEFSAPFTSKNAAGEPLISPCFCRGTMGLYHRTCLERWLGTSNTDRCEICKFLYVVERRPLPLMAYLKDPGSPIERRNLIGDFACWCVLTPLALISAYLCAHGAILYAGQFGWLCVEVTGLMLLSFFLVLTYGVWLVVSIKYHMSTFREWQQSHQDVHVLDIEEVHMLKTSPVRIVLATASAATTNVSFLSETTMTVEGAEGGAGGVRPTDLSSRLLAGPMHASTPQMPAPSSAAVLHFGYTAPPGASPNYMPPPGAPSSNYLPPPGTSPNPIVTPNGSSIRFDQKTFNGSGAQNMETAV